MSRNDMTVLLMLAVAWALGIVVVWDAEEQDSQDDLYCEMVEIWRNNKHIPEIERPGWPPYRGEGACAR